MKQETPKTFKELFANTGIKPTTDKNGNIQYNFKATMKEEPKQETLEEFEAALIKFPEYDQFLERNAFIEGAKWQQERSYSEEEVIELLQKALTHKDDGEIGSLVTAQGEIRTANFFSWFERFKKK
jgi:hypothetical protein